MKNLLTVADVLAAADKKYVAGYQTGLRVATHEVKAIAYVHGVVRAHVDVATAYVTEEEIAAAV